MLGQIKKLQLDFSKIKSYHQNIKIKFYPIRKFSKIKGFIENKISLKILTPEQELKLKKDVNL